MLWIRRSYFAVVTKSPQDNPSVAGLRTDDQRKLEPPGLIQTITGVTTRSQTRWNSSHGSEVDENGPETRSNFADTRRKHLVSTRYQCSPGQLYDGQSEWALYGGIAIAVGVGLKSIV